MKLVDDDDIFRLLTVVTPAICTKIVIDHVREALARPDGVALFMAGYAERLRELEAEARKVLQ